MAPAREGRDGEPSGRSGPSNLLSSEKCSAPTNGRPESVDPRKSRFTTARVTPTSHVRQKRVGWGRMSTEEINDDTPLRLHQAAKIAFPGGGVSAATLRSAAKRGQLVIERVGGKDFTTLGHIKRMREQCRVKQVRRDCGCDQRAETKRAGSPMLPPGLSSIAVAKSALDSTLQTLSGPRKL